MDPRFDPMGSEEFAQFVASFDAYHELVIDMLGVIPGDTEFEWKSRQSLTIAASCFSPGFIRTRKARKLRAKHSRLDRVEATVPPHDLVAIFLTLAVVAKGTHIARQFFVVRSHRAAIAKCSEVLRGVETEPGRGSHAPAGPALIGRAVGLGGIFEDRQSVPLRHGENLVHLGGLPVKMNGDDGLRARSDGRRYLVRIDGQNIGQAVDKYGSRSPTQNGQQRSDKGIRNRDDFVTRTYTQGLERPQQSIASARDPYAMPGST